MNTVQITPTPPLEAYVDAAGSAVPDRAADLLSRMILGQNIKADLDRRYVVKNWIYADTLGVTYGAPGSSKSFFVLDLLRHVVSGEPWRGERVKQTSALYIAGEGAAGISNRIVASGGVGEGFVFLPALVNLCSNEVDARAIVDAFRACVAGMPGVIVIDTLARAMGGGDENAPQDMGRLIRHADILRELTGAHVHLVHHSGKDAGKGLRGHSSLLGAVNTEIYVEKLDDGLRLATITKQKDGEEGLSVAYRLTPVDLGFDLDGEQVTSCRVDRADTPAKDSRAMNPSPKQRAVLDALRQYIDDNGKPSPGGTGWPEIGARQIVDADAFKRFAAEKQHGDTPKQRSRAVRDALDGLDSKGLIASNEGHLWIVQVRERTGT